MNCENCVYCEMYSNDSSLCSIKEQWVDSNLAQYCDYFVLDGGSNE